MEPLPEFEQLSDGQLDRLIDELTAREERISLERRVLHGTIDLLLAERSARCTGDPRAPVDVPHLAQVLAQRRPPGWLAHERLAVQIAV
jgi:hypothetical protein